MNSTSNKQAQYDAIILGAGASGLFCALTAAQRGLSILVLEKANKVGKKILMSGGGRCNFTNRVVEPDHFISVNSHFCKAALSRYTHWDFIAMVEKQGIVYEERDHGRLFCEDSSADILDMLLQRCDEAGVVIETHCNIHAVTTNDNDENYRYCLKGEQKEQTKAWVANSLVVATGGLSIPSLGGSRMGYELAQQFDLPVTNLEAGLVPLMFSGNMKLLCERLSGLALLVSASSNKQTFTENLLFTHRGMSGPVMLQISNYWSAGEEIVIDLLPELDVGRWLLECKNHQKGSANTMRYYLNQKLAKSLVLELQALWWADIPDKPLAELSDDRLFAIGKNINAWILKPSASEGYRTSEFRTHNIVNIAA